MAYPQPESTQYVPSRGRQPDHPLEFRGKSPWWLPYPNGLSRQAPWAFTTHARAHRDGPHPVAKEACGQPGFSTRNLVSSSEHAFVHSTSLPFSWPMKTDSSSPLFVQMRKLRPTPEPAGFQRSGETLRLGKEGTGVAGQRVARAELRHKRLVVEF